MVERGLCASRQQAQRAILAGRVAVNGQIARKASDLVRTSDRIELHGQERYVSRGGYKLEAALHQFQIHPFGWRAIDLGAATGGFTDCLLQHGVRQVYAVDVGRGLLAWKLRQDPRVVVMEGYNARFLRPEHFPQPFDPVDLVVVDCSFISLRLILPVAVALVRLNGTMIALVKPQFEAGRREASRGQGVIRNPAVHARVLEELRVFACESLGLRWRAVMESPLRGPAGNLEFLVHLERPC